MARYQLGSYKITIRLPNGTWINRIKCPDCGDLHYDIAQHEECLCSGCGKTLYVDGLELFAFEIPEGWYGEEEHYTGEDPEYPGFWYDFLN